MMKTQLHKRLTLEFVEDVPKAFNERHLSEHKACPLMGIKRTRLYRFHQRWLECMMYLKFFLLYGLRDSYFLKLPEQRSHRSVGMKLKKQAKVG
jgi:hypothetical protein